MVPKIETNVFPDNKTYINMIILNENKKIIGNNRIIMKFMILIEQLIKYWCLNIFYF